MDQENSSSNDLCETIVLAIFAQYSYIEHANISLSLSWIFFDRLLFSTTFPTLRVSICFCRLRHFHVKCRRSHLHAFTHKILYNNEKKRTRAKQFHQILTVLLENKIRKRFDHSNTTFIGKLEIFFCQNIGIFCNNRVFLILLFNFFF